MERHDSAGFGTAQGTKNEQPVDKLCVSCARSGRKPRRFGATPGSDEMRVRPALRGARWAMGQNTICGVLSKADFRREAVSETAVRRCVPQWWLIAGLAIHWLRWHQLVQSPQRRGIANRSRLKSRSRESGFASRGTTVALFRSQAVGRSHGPAPLVG